MATVRVIPPFNEVEVVFPPGRMPPGAITESCGSCRHVTSTVYEKQITSILKEAGAGGR